MSGTEVGLALSVLLACAVEAVEALTIVLAVGTTRSWSSALYGAGAAVAALAVVVAALGPALASLPLNALRVGVGGLLLVFGLQWLRKAILRAAGLKELHDETAAFAEETEAARAAGAAPGSGLDGYSFAISFKGVFLEGLEVAFIVLTFGANQHRVPLAAAAAAVAVALVVLAGVAARAPLAIGRSSLVAVAAVGLADVTANALFAFASGHGLLALVAVLGSLYPIATVLLAHVVLGERLTRAQQLGIGVALAGVAAIAGG